MLRDGKISSVAAWALVRGDVLMLRAGDRVPADCRIVQVLSTAGLRVQSAALYGYPRQDTLVSEPVSYGVPPWLSKPSLFACHYLFLLLVCL